MVPRVPERQRLKLKELLHAHVVEEMPRMYMSLARGRRLTHRRVQTSPQGSGSLDPAYPNHGVVTFLLFDVGQATYEDQHLGIPSLSVFMTVSSATTLFYFAVMEARQQVLWIMIIEEACRHSYVQRLVCLCGMRSIPSADCLIQLNSTRSWQGTQTSPNESYCWILNFRIMTGGHVGAVVELLHLVSYQVSLLRRTTLTS